MKAVTGLGYANCLAAAATRALDAALVTGDADFRRVEGQVTVEWLPPAPEA